ncbi:MAG: 4Fe-4S dicluster domain-containing protein, partial [Halobacteria archaeon]|nr:4Fe-4S dicluster domain-containing protein [Halobacteria archaeon]
MSGSGTQKTDVDGQVAWVFDLNKCMGCPTCSIACHDLWTNDEDTKDQWWCTVSTKPGEGHPKGWEEMGGGYDEDGNLILGERPTDETTHDHVEHNWNPNEANQGENPEILPEEKPDWTFNWEEDEGAGEHPNSWHFYLPKICMQCSHASCVEACPEDAIFKRDEDGIVVI